MIHTVILTKHQEYSSPQYLNMIFLLLDYINILICINLIWLHKMFKVLESTVIQ